VRFHFSRSPLDPAEPASGFDLGDVEITGPEGSVGSAGRRPDQSFMVYLGMVDLIDGLTAVAEGQRREHKFVGADSSFTVRFFRNKGGISASAYGASLGSEPVPDVLGGLRAGIDEFLADPANALPPDDPAARDLTAALAKLPPATG
jgi:hypothetical protein